MVQDGVGHLFKVAYNTGYPLHPQMITRTLSTIKN